MSDWNDEMKEPRGAEYDRLAWLARVTRPEAPPDFADRVMRALEDLPVSEARRPEKSGFLEGLRNLLLPSRTPGLVGALGLAGLALILAAIMSRQGAVGTSPRPEPMVQNDSRPAEDLVYHTFEFDAPEASQVCLVGDFNEWDLCRVPLERDHSTGTWSIRLGLPRGRHEYMFVVDEKAWVTDPVAPVRVDDGFGNVNAVVFL